VEARRIGRAFQRRRLISCIRVRCL
jgi:hypothetical protein